MVETVIFVTCVVCVVLAGLGLILCFVYNDEERFSEANDDNLAHLFLGCVISSMITLIVLLISCKITWPTPKDYPQSKYTLEYKVTEFHGKKDTTYVLTLKR